MKRIELKKMTLTNFKGAKDRVVEFGSSASFIAGGNGTGKTTIYEAYMWCLFNKNPYGNEIKVQPLDAKNNVIHNLETIVKLDLMVDGSQISLERRLKEDWTKPRGSSELVLKGTSSTYFVNDVPMTLAEYNAKLNLICDTTKWFLLSSINILPNMEQKSRRLALQSIAPEFNEADLAKEYHAVLDALSRGVSADELARTTKNNRAKAKADLDNIPARIDEIEKLRVSMDFEKEHAREKELIAELQEIDNKIYAIKNPELDSVYLKKSMAQRTKLENLRKSILEIESAANIKERQDRDSWEKETSGIKIDQLTAETNIKALEIKLQNNNANLESERKTLESLRNQWTSTNNQEQPSFDGICPTCGQPLPAYKIKEAEDNWRKNKADQLKRIEDLAQETKRNISNYKEEIAQNQSSLDDWRTKHEECISKATQANDKKFILAEDLLKSNQEYLQMVAEFSEIENNIKATSEESESNINEQLNPLTEQRIKIANELVEVRKNIAQEQTNTRIDAQRKELENQQRQLANVIAECEGVEAQVDEFKKRKITMVEENVSSMFELVHWKMYEPNISNDGEKEICQAIIDGIPYEQQNTATKFNAAIDMVNAFSKAYEVNVPLFIDNKESVSELLRTEAQIITLSVVDGADFQITNI